MSKFLNLEMPVAEVIEATTWNSAKAIKREELGHLSEGAVADVTILKLHEGNFGFIDSKGRKMSGEQKLECEVTIREGKVVYDLNGLAATFWNE